MAIKSDIAVRYPNNSDLKGMTDEQLVDEEIRLRKDAKILLCRANRCVFERNLRIAFASHRENENARKLAVKVGSVIEPKGPSQ